MKTLWRQLRVLLTPPAYWSDEKQRQADALHVSFLLMVGSGLLYFTLPAWILAGQDTYYGLAIACGVTGSLLLRSGYLRFSGILSVFTLWAIFTFAAYTEGGLTSDSFAGQVTTIVFAGLVLGLQGAIASAVCSILAGGLLVYLSHQNLLPPPAVIYTPFNLFADYSLYLSFTALFTGIAVRRIDLSSARTKKELEERKKAEQALLLNEQRLRDIIFSMGDWVWEVDDRGVYTFSSQKGVDLLGYSREEIIGKTPFDFMQPEEANRVREVFSEIATKKMFIKDLENWNIGKDGRRICLLTNGVPILDSDGNLKGYRGVDKDITDRKQFEEALKESRELLSLFMRHSPVFAYIKEVTPAESRVLLASDNFDQMIGIPGGEMTGKTMAELFPPQFAAKMTADDWSVVSRGSVLQLEEELNGRHYHTIKFPILQGERTLLAGYTIDVTDRKEAERSLSENAEFFRLVSGLTSDYIFVDKITDEGKTELTFLSGALEQITGYTEEEFRAIGHWRTTVHPDDIEKDDRDFQKLLRNEKIDSEIRTIHKNGHTTWMRVYAQPIWDDKANKLVGISGAVQDITERKLAEEALERERSLLRALLDNIPDHIYFKDAESRFVTMNKAQAEAFGLTDPVHGVGKSDHDFFAEEHAQQAFNDEQNIMKLGRPTVGIEEKETWPDGHVTWVSTTKMPLRDRDGEIIGTFGISRDITEHKQTEEAFRQAQKSQSIATLAGGIAHDFNNLLNAILGQSALALGKLTKESPASGNVAKAIKAAERAADLTRQLLAYSGKGKFLIEEIDLNLFIEENVQMLEVSIPKTAQLRFALGRFSPIIRGDTGQLQQVIMNLIINAGEAIGAHPGFIDIRTDQIELTQNHSEYWKYTSTPLTPGRYASLEISDTGHGMSPEVQARIFEPFYSSKFVGRGLGLAAVLGIVKGHWGGIRLSSKEGKGTRFELVFPLVESPTAPKSPEVERSPEVTGKGKTVLVIDDEPSVLELLQDIFEEAQFKVIGSLNPLEGIEMFRGRQEEVAIVILDYSMPGMDGKAAFAELVKIKNNVKVLLCSGYTEEQMESTFGELRPAGFIHKPYQPAVLLERVSSLLPGSPLSAF